ncbi:MAG: hypothetical protein PUJ21_04815, partial [Clostridia bacterium]|nr:hypothetical protein [Clostridia bacterium]MDY6183874.1 hypothetical protein [Eubacteriales bacterium]
DSIYHHSRCILFCRQDGGSKPPPYDKELSHFVADETSRGAPRRSVTFVARQNFTSSRDETSPYGGSKPPPYEEKSSRFAADETSLCVK